MEGGVLDKTIGIKPNFALRPKSYFVHEYIWATLYYPYPDTMQGAIYSLFNPNLF